MCFLGQREQYSHGCFLVGPVINGEPVASFNRRVVWVALSSHSVETGTLRAVKLGKGRIKNIVSLGRIIVALEDHLRIVEHWAEDLLKDIPDATFEDVVNGVQKRINMNSPSTEGDNMGLDIFSAIIVNHTQENVFVYKKPSSFP